MDVDDPFSDDDFDQIPDNALTDLEHGAISSTQHQQHQQRQWQQSTVSGQPARKFAHNATSLHRSAGSVSNPAWKLPQRSQQFGNQSKASVPPPSAPAPPPPPSDYGVDDEDVIDLDDSYIPDNHSSHLPIRNNASTDHADASSHRSHSRLPSDPETEAIYAAADAELGTHRPGHWAQAPHLAPSANGIVDAGALQARIRDLEAEQVRLQQSEKEAREAALAGKGEILIVRAKQEQATKDYERRLAVMQRLHADEAAKQRAEIEAQRKEREKMETDNRFLQHDLAQETNRAKRPGGAARTRAAPAKPFVSPRRKTLALGDGFADEEIAVVSPSKSKERSRDQTPRAGAKRKRDVNDSPAAPLSFSHPVQPEHEGGAHSFASTEVTLQAGTNVSSDARYDLAQRVLGHRPHPRHPKTVEALIDFHFPSDATRSLSAMILTAISGLSNGIDSPALVFTRMLLGLWARCLKEKYYGPLNLILNLIRFVLDFELPSTCTALIEDAVPVCLDSLELIENPRAKAAQNSVFAATINRKEMDKQAMQVQVGEVLDFLLYLAQASTLGPERNEVFWRLMTFEVTNVMINKAHPLEQIIVGLQIIRTSCRSTSFAAISDDVERQTTMEHATLQGVTFLLPETPNVPVGEPPYEDDELVELRLEILRVLEDLCATSNGCLLIAQHRLAIGKLFEALEAFVRKLYSLSPSQPSKSSDRTSSDQNAHDLVVQCINLAVRIIYHVLRTHSDLIDLQQMLSAVHGGYHKFLVGLTRIAFTEQLVLDAGIDSEAIEAAHSILDNVLSPEEGEAVVKALETPRGTTTSNERTRPNSTDDGGDTTILDAPG